MPIFRDMGRIALPYTPRIKTAPAAPYTQPRPARYNLPMITNRRNLDTSEIIRQVAITAGRAILGLAMGVVLSMIAMAVAWGLWVFIFSGSSSRTAWMVMFLAGAGIGAGIGAYIAWLKVDRPPWAAIALTLLLTVAGGIAGGVLGYDYGAGREIECCAQPRTGPLTYTAFGAGIMANIAIYLTAAAALARRRIRAARGNPLPR